MFAHYLLYAVILIGGGCLLWRFVVKPKLDSLPDEEPLTVDELRARIAHKRAELAELERDAASLTEEVSMTERIRDRRRELGKLTDKLKKLESGMPDDPRGK